MKLSALKTNAKAIEEGRWMKDLPYMGKLRLHVRGIGNQDYKSLFDKLSAAVPLDKRINGVIIAGERERIQTELLIQTILLNWDGLEDDDDKPIAYSELAAREYLTNPDYRMFRDAVLLAAGMVGEQADEVLKVDEKN